MYAVIRIRGHVKTRGDIEDALEAMRLNRVNHLVLLPEEKNIQGMLQKAGSHLTWGEVDEASLSLLLSKRLRLKANTRPAAAAFKKAGVKDAGKLAAQLLEGKTTLLKAGFSPVLRLSPPRKGHGRKGIRRGVKEGGAAGYRGATINELIRRMA